MKFYRKVQGAVLGGVCLGISEELSIDPMIIRLIAITALIISSGLVGLIYIILWAILPAVDTKTNIKDEVMDKLEKHSYLKDKIKNPNIIGIILVVIGLLIFIDVLLPLDLIIKFIFPLALVGVGIYLLFINNKR